MAEAVNGSKYAAVPGRIPGRPINLGGVDLVLAPLNLDGVREFVPLQKRFGEVKPDDMDGLFRVAAESLHLSLRRNYPDITVDQIVGLLDAGNLMLAMDGMAEASGFRRNAVAGETGPAPSSNQ